MYGYVANIETLTLQNTNYRHVLYTGHQLQLVLMSLKAGEDIGEETHKGHDQFFRVESGEGEVVIDGTRHPLRAGDAIVVPAGARHNLINTGNSALRIYTLYGPPNHMDRLVQTTKSEAEAAHETFDGQATE